MFYIALAIKEMTSPRLEWQVQCLQPSFIVNYWLCVFLDLDSGTLDLSLQHWTSHFEAGTSASFILTKKLCLFLDLESGTLNLSLQHWPCLLMTKYDCFKTWMFGHWTCILEHWIPLPNIGLVILKLGSTFSKNLCLFLNLEAGALNLSLQHRTCLLEASVGKPFQHCY